MHDKPTMKTSIAPLNPAAIILQKRLRKTSLPKDARGASLIMVRARPGKRTQGLVSTGAGVLPCALGRGGISALKREGDGATPLAVLRPLTILYRRDRWPWGIGPVWLPVLPVRPDLGWCDLPQDPNYNRPVRLPYPGRHERMMRQDQLYDICVVLDWNVLPRRRNGGSAIFLHVARPGGPKGSGMEPTEGCIAVSPRAMARLLPLLTRETRIVVLR